MNAEEIKAQIEIEKSRLSVLRKVFSSKNVSIPKKSIAKEILKSKFKIKQLQSKIL